MRLYDQRSSTLMKPDDKWMRPNNFLPSQRDAFVTKTKSLDKKRTVLAELTDNTTCGSETSSSTGIEISKLFKQNTIYDDFRFDIDEEQELSIKSSSTLSTHSTLRCLSQDRYNGYANEFPKPVSMVKYDAFDTNSRYSKTSSISSTLWEDIVSETDATVDENKLKDEFLTPQLTLTQSSEEESASTWIEFEGFDLKKQHHATCISDRDFSNELDQFPTSISMNHQLHGKENFARARYPLTRSKNFGSNRHKVPNGNSKYDQTGHYTKYYNMLLEGISIDELLKTMEKDRVDPSIIYLVLVASRSNQNS